MIPIAPPAGGYSRDRFSVTALYVWLEKPGVAFSFGFLARSGSHKGMAVPGARA